MRLLLVEDDPLVGDGICTGLGLAGFQTDWVKDGKAAQLAMAYGDYSIILLDLGLPLLDGISLLNWFKTSYSSQLILVLSARDSKSDIVTGLNSGADDYLTKPFDLDELIARIHALMRRGKQVVSTPLMQSGPLSLNPSTHQVTFKGEAIELSLKEFAVLHTLLLNQDQVLSREQLENKIYGWGQEVDSNSVEVHIHHLRRKLGNQIVRTIRGKGYVMDRPYENDF